jgi:hypothetical protein
VFLQKIRVFTSNLIFTSKTSDVLDTILLENQLFLDIETVPEQRNFDALSPLMQELWIERFTKTAPDSSEAADGYRTQAGIFAEFGKIICISAGYFHGPPAKQKLRIKSFYDDDESILLGNFLETIIEFSAKIPRLSFCGHNIREFDIPYICRRTIVRQLKLPAALDFHGKKPWELMLLDTMQLWRFGDHRNYSSLKLLAGILGIPTPKDDIDGSEVAGVYWQAHDLPRIARYCEKDVITVAQLLLRFKLLPLLTDNDIEIVP